MDTEQDALRRNIAHKREEIVEDLDRLEGTLRDRYESTTDWHRVVRGHPLTAAGAAAGVGLFLGLLATRAVD